MNQHFKPTKAQLQALMALPADQPVAVLNLFQFNQTANYQPEDPEHGTDAANISGEEAYQRYGAIAGKVIDKLGGRVAMSAAVDQMLIGPEETDWHIAAIMFFPSRAAFMQMMADSDFQAASRHRKAALANHHMLHLDGSSFVS